MGLDSTYLIYTALFVGALLLFEGAYLLVFDARIRPQENVNRRIRMLASDQSTQEVMLKLRRGRPKLMSLGRFFPSIEKLLSRAGMTMSSNYLASLMMIAAFLTFAFCQVVAKLPLSTSLMATVFAGVVMPIVIVWWRGSRRRKAFGAQLPDGLDTIVRSLQAGHPINAALDLVAKEMPDPIGTEFGIAVDEITYGLELKQALENLSHRIEHPEMQFVVVSIKIQQGTGGNLAEVLSNVSSVIRARFRMYRKIKAVSAEGRGSAILLSAMPVLVGLAIFLLNPEYYLQVVDDPLFWPIIGGGVTGIFVGVAIMWRLVNFKV